MATVEEVMAALDEGTAREAQTRLDVGDPLASRLHNTLNLASDYELRIVDGRTAIDVTGDARVAELAGWIERATDGLDNPVWQLTPAGETALEASRDALDRKDAAEDAALAADGRWVWWQGAMFGSVVSALTAAVGTTLLWTVFG